MLYYFFYLRLKKVLMIFEGLLDIPELVRKKKKKKKRKSFSFSK